MTVDADAAIQKELETLKSQISGKSIPQNLSEKIEHMMLTLSRAVKYGGYSTEYERINHYLHWVSEIPWGQYSTDELDLARAEEVLNKHHYGLGEVKERILEFLAVLKLNADRGNTEHIARAPILLLVGLVGTGKTTFAYGLAEAMKREIVRIPFGGMGSARDLRGQSRMHPESEPGYMIKALARSKTLNPVILLDEIDRVSEAARADIMGVLVELLDPEQNKFFIDHYLDYPVDLSQVLFIGTANNTSHIATAVLDRMEPISMPSYSDEEKIVIAKQFLLPRAIEETALPEGVLTIQDEVWPQIVRPLGYDAGIRTLQRTIQGVVRKIAKLYVQGQLQQLHLNDQNIKEYLPSFKTEII